VADVGAELPASEPLNPMLSQQLHDTLARAVELTETFEAQNRLPIHASSRLRRDEAVGNAASVFNTASVAIVGALDHLTTWYQTVAGDLKRFPLPVFSHYTLARAAYEPALLTLWLLDPGVDSVECIGRGYAAQLRSLEDMRKFQHDAGMTGEAANATSLHERLFAAARAAGCVSVDSDGKERLTSHVPDMVRRVPPKRRSWLSKVVPSSRMAWLSCLNGSGKLLLCVMFTACPPMRFLPFSASVPATSVSCCIGDVLG
jgi:hypothetical protein